MLITCDATALLAFIQRINGLLQVSESAFGLRDLPPELARINIDDRSASAGELAVRLDPSDGLRGFAAALLARDSNRLIVQESAHEEPSL